MHAICIYLLLSSTTELKTFIKLSVKRIASSNLLEGNLTDYSFDFKLLYMLIIIALPIFYGRNQLFTFFSLKIFILCMRCKS